MGSNFFLNFVIILVMVNKSVNKSIKWIFSNVLIPSKFYNVLCYKCNLFHDHNINSLARIFYRFDVFLHVRIILHHLVIPLPYGNGCSKVRSSCVKSAYYSVCCGWNVEEWVYFIQHCTVILVMVPQSNLTIWIIPNLEKIYEKILWKGE